MRKKGKHDKLKLSSGDKPDTVTFSQLLNHVNVSEWRIRMRLKSTET